MAISNYDLVVFGATSFVGQILTHYLAEHLAVHDVQLRWAIAGRSEAKLIEVKRSPTTAARSDGQVASGLPPACSMNALSSD